MAIYHLHGQIIKRVDGRSAVAAAAYRTGKLVLDKRLDQEFDYTRKHEVEESVILAPEGAPQWLLNTEALWNTVEAAERRKNSQLAREFDIALPIELVEKNPEAAKELLKAWAHDEFVKEGFIVEISFHKMRGKNPHGHVMKPQRRLHAFAMEFAGGSPLVFEEAKARDLNDWGYMDHWRKTWADHANAAMAKHGIDARIDHRTLIEQDITDREPGIHIGPNANAMQARGLETGRWLKNAMIWFDNEEPWFEENRRYVAFLDAEAAEERQRQQEEAATQEAERKEIEAAAAVVARANELEDLARRLAAATDRQIGKSAMGLADVSTRLDDRGKAPIVAAQLAFDNAIGGLARAQGQIEAGLQSRREAVAGLEVRLVAAAQRAVASEASRLRRSVERLTPAFENLLGNHAIRLYEVADRLEAQAPHLPPRGKGLDVATENSQEAKQKPEPVAAKSEKAMERSPAVGSQLSQMTAHILDRVRAVFASQVIGIRSGAARTFEDGRAMVRSLTAASIVSISTVSEVTAGAARSAILRAALFLKELGGRERVDARGASTDQAVVEVLAGAQSGPPRQEPEGQLFEQRFSVLARVRSLAASLRRARAARKTEAAAKMAKAAEAALDRNVRLAEDAIRVGIDHSTPDTERDFVREWIRTLKSTAGPMVTRYEEADRVALKGYALRLDRYPRFGELDRVLIRLSPFAGGVNTEAKNAPQELPDGMKPDFRDRAIYTKHVRWVAQELQVDVDVITHFRQLLRASVEAEERSFDISREIDRGRHTGRIPGKPGQERDA